jgi:dephospho-CoA kinase
MGIRVVGLTGGIATGKSSVARFLIEKGAVVIDADELSRVAVRPGSPALNRIVAEFGADMLLPDGNLDRKRMRSAIFGNDEKRHLLEQIIHPEIKRLADEGIAAAAADGQRIVFFMAPLLIETGGTDRVDEVWVVTARPEIQLQRVMDRDGISSSEARKIIDSQMPLAEKERYGRVVIDNSGTPEQTRQLVDAIWEKEMGEKHDRK